MSKSDIWMPLYVGEYLADTMRLTTVQHGAYLLLLMQYWKSGPLPDDEEELAAIAKMEAKAWGKISASIRRFFDIAQDGLLHQKRADFERAKAADISSKRRAAASQRTDRKSASDDQTGASGPSIDKQEDMQLQQQEHVQLQPQLDTHARGLPQSPTTETEVKKDNRSLRSLPQRQAVEAEPFEEFWSRYPRKVGKDAARKAYAAAIKRGAHPNALLDAVEHQQWPADFQFIPHPATWLNGGRWQDDPEAAAPVALVIERENPAERRIRETREAMHRMTYPEQYADEGVTIDHQPQQGKLLS